MAVARKMLFWLGVPAVLLLVAGALVGVVALSFREAPRRTLVFPDGSRVTVLGASLAGQSFTTDTLWQATLRRWLPSKWQGSLRVPLTVTGVPYYMVPASSNALWVWFKLETNYSRPRANLESNTSLRDLWLAPLSKSGSRYRAREVSSALRSLTVQGTKLYAMSFSAFPRRQREFELQLVDKQMKVLGSVTVPNPVREPFPKWKPKELPAVHTNGPVVITLQEVSEILSRGDPTMVPEIRLVFHATNEAREVPTGWPRLYWSDATGNIGMPLDKQEAAWKVSFRIDQSIWPDYKQVQQFVVPNLRVPGPGGLQVLSNQFEVVGVKVKLLCLAGVGTLAATNNGGLAMLTSDSTPSADALRNPRSMSGGLAGNGPVQDPEWALLPNDQNTVRTMAMSNPFFLLEDNRPGFTDEVRFGVVGADGRELQRLTPARKMSSSDAERSTSGRMGHTYVVPFYATNFTGSVTLQVQFSGPREFEFIIDPKKMKLLPE